MTTSTPERLTRAVVDNARTAGRAGVSLLRDGGYATIGATDAAMSYVRSVGTRANEARDALRSMKLPKPTDVTETLRGLGAEVEEQFESLAGRGREVVDSLQGSRATRTAADRTRVARSQMKAAATSAQRAGEATADAVDGAADRIARGDVDYADMTVEELRGIARARDIEGRSDMNKAQLVEALRNA
ncbi:MAG TPA: Rho termination factor N-terminal domain-containing protein [Euzebyales bacterium]|nr:Rho termination factor N-terminal domain-containing protein [Euzebyales bacterium]